MIRRHSRKPIPRKRAKPRRVGVLRDPGYLKFLREECVCVVCEAARKTLAAAGFTRDRGYEIHYSDPIRQRIIDPAHGPVNGMGSKGPDNEAIALCRLHHDEQTAIGHQPFALKHGFDWIREAAWHYERYQVCRENL